MPNLVIQVMWIAVCAFVIKSSSIIVVVVRKILSAKFHVHVDRRLSYKYVIILSELIPKRYILTTDEMKGLL